MKATDTIKFFFQYLLSPLLLLVIGFVINSSVERQKQALQKIQITEDIVKNVFDGNPHKAFTLVGLLPSLIEDKDVIDTITYKVKYTIANRLPLLLKMEMIIKLSRFKMRQKLD